MKAEIGPQKTPTGRTRPGRFDVTVTGYAKGGLRYLSLSVEELEVLTGAWAIIREDLLKGAK